MSEQRDSGGVSGEDGELIARLRDSATFITDKYPGPDRFGHWSNLRHTAADRIVALLAERDGLKALYDAGVKQWGPVYEIVLNRADKAEAALSASNAALAEALGLLRESRIEFQLVDTGYSIRALATVPWTVRRDALLAKHGKTEETK